MALPSVFAYRDHRAFLSDWLEARRGEDPTYSLAVFARDGGCSKAALANVIAGARQPRPSTVLAFARAMGLTPAEHDYLRLLVALADAATLERRREVLGRILETERYAQKRLSESTPEADVDRYLSHWCIPAIREMAVLPGFRTDPGWIAERMVPPIAPELAAQALDTLLGLGFLQRTDDGALTQRELRFATEPDTTQRAVARFHREQVPAMVAALDPDRGRQQHLLTATLALDAGLLEEAKTRLNAVLGQLATLADEGSTEGPRRVYQLSVQLLPLSEPLGSEGPADPVTVRG